MFGVKSVCELYFMYNLRALYFFGGFAMNISIKRYLKEFDLRQTSVDILFEIVGSMLISIGLYNFALTSEFPMTGFSGIAMILHRLFGWQIGLTTMLLNIPVAIFSYRLLGRRFFLKSIRCIIISSYLIDVVAPLLPTYSGDRFLAALCTGVFAGVGYAMIYLRNSSTGGADFIIMSAKAIWPHIPLGKIIFISDVGIILAGGIIFHDIDGIIYGMIINYMFATISDKILENINSGKMALIVTDNGSQISDAIDECCQRGSTILSGFGGYKQDEKHVVMVACSEKELYKVESSVKQADPNCFMIMLDSNEVVGEGFKRIRIADTQQG